MGRTLEDRFWSKVRMGDGCWEWIGARDAQGYGNIWQDPLLAWSCPHWTQRSTDGRRDEAALPNVRQRPAARAEGPFMTLTWFIGDTRQVLATMTPASVNCVVTSSPYLAKRAYLPADDPLKPLEQGQEATPADFLAGMLEVTDLLWDVVADDGVVFWNLGDTASGSGGAGGDYSTGGMRDGQQRFDGSASKAYGLGRAPRPARVGREMGKVRDPRDVGRPINDGTGGPGWPRAKSVCWVPELFGASLAYGRNLLTGQPCRQWITRPPMTWCKPNPSVGAIRDKFREATELVVMAVKQGAYWFDLDPVRTPAPRVDNKRTASTEYEPPGQPTRKRGQDLNGSRLYANEKGAPPLNWQDWPADALPAAAIGSPAQYPGAHYAVMPPWLARLLITVGCPVGGHVLDPYAGSGTTLDAAHSLGRNAVGVDLDPRNVALAQDRLGMFPIAVHDHTGASA